MKSFNRINNLTGWLVFAVSAVTYIATLEQTASFWDCGEFIAVSYKLMVPHPPGAPFFLLINRMFSMLAIGEVEQVAYWVNVQSALSSAFTILFLFWTIVFVGRKFIRPGADGVYTTAQTATLMIGSAIGALAYTFSDSFWFSAAEAEVYAMSSFFTAFVVWAMFKWEYIEDESASARWLLLIAYMTGLSIGVHLLNLVTLPALALIYYFKKYPKVTPIGLLASTGAGLLIVAVIMVGIIPGLPSLAGNLEVFFVNSFKLPFGSGVFVLGASLLGGLVYGIRYSQQNNKPVLNILLLSLVFILIGYSSYTLVLIRSNHNPPIDENNPENLISFVSYLKREQYGSRPLLYGPTFMAERTGVKEGDLVYAKGKDQYIVVDQRSEAEYDSRNSILLPRIYSQQPGHPELYRRWIGLKEGERPNFFHNIFYMFRYQFGHMYFRYFMWNFAGRESDEKDAGWMMPWEPEKEGIPEELARNKARKNLYMLPLALGLIGFFYHQRKDARNFWVLLSLFVLTGLAIVVYLNPPPVEPRERDYIYVGSFYVFAIWIGLGMMGIAEALERVLKNGLNSAIAAGALCAAVPALMAAKGWDSHDRSDRWHSVDQAYNTLASCAPNAILFTGGDNDTFPLWYIQDVEGFRTDVRVAVMSYFSTDWYLEQMRRQMYESAPIPLTLSAENYRSGKNDYIPLVEDQRAKGGVNLATYLKLLNNNDRQVMVELADGSFTGRMLSRRFLLDVDSAKVANMEGVIPADKKDRVLPQMVIDLQQRHRAIFKNELALLDLIASNNWERPIYFNNTSANTLNMELRPYMHLEGMTYRLLPVRAQNTEGDLGEASFEELKQNIAKFKFRGFDNPNTYHDDEYRKFGANARNIYYRLAQEYSRRGDKENAIATLDEGLRNIPDYSIPYSFYIPRYIQLYHQLGEHEKAEELEAVLLRRARENIAYIVRTKRDFEDLRQKSLLHLQQISLLYRELEEKEGEKVSRLTARIESGIPLETEGGAAGTQAQLEEAKKRQEYYLRQAKEYTSIFYNQIDSLEKIMQIR